MKRRPDRYDATWRAAVVAIAMCFVVVMVVRPKLDARRETVVASGGAGQEVPGAALPSIIKSRWP